MVSVGVNSSAANNGEVTVTTTGSNSDSGNTFTIEGAGGISLASSTANNIVITGTTYELGSAAVVGASSVNTANITLTDSNNTS